MQRKSGVPADIYLLPPRMHLPEALAARGTGQSIGIREHCITALLHVLTATISAIMIGADRAMSNPGDSGAVAYKLSGVGSYAKAVGVLKGKISGNTVFIRADIIKRMFGAEAY